MATNLVSVSILAANLESAVLRPGSRGLDGSLERDMTDGSRIRAEQLIRVQTEAMTSSRKPDMMEINIGFEHMQLAKRHLGSRA